MQKFSFEKKKRNLTELDIKTRVNGVIGIKLFLAFFHPQIEAGALGYARIYKAAAERVNRAVNSLREPTSDHSCRRCHYNGKNSKCSSSFQ